MTARRAVVLLTSTVEPAAGVQYLALRDPEERLRQVLHALASWRAVAAAMNADLVVADSSPALSERRADALRRAVGEGGATLNLFPQDAEVEEKGAAEAALLDAATHSLASKGYETIIKCTGRLRLANWKAALAWDEPPILRIAIRADFDRVDTRLFVVSLALWEARFRDMGPSVDEQRGVFLEHVMARRCFGALADGANVDRFPAMPRFQGYSGSTGRRYDTRPGLVKRAALATARAVMTRGGEYL